MDRERSGLPILWDDRGKVAKAFDVGIFSNFRNLGGFRFRQCGHPVLDVLSERDRRFFHERVLLTAAPCGARGARTSCSSGCHQKVNLSFLCHGRPHSRLPLPWPFLSAGRMNFTMQPKASEGKHAMILPA